MKLTFRQRIRAAFTGWVAAVSEAAGETLYRIQIPDNELPTEGYPEETT